MSDGAVRREEELARLRRALEEVRDLDPPPAHAPGRAFAPNPALRLLRLSWRNLAPLALACGAAGAEPAPGDEAVLAWRAPGTGDPACRPATEGDLLALKIVVEGIDPAAAAAAGGLPAGAVESVLHRAADAGILLAPRSLIRRADDFPRGAIRDPAFFEATGFTLQWHLTQACDLSCRHCYDRSSIAAMPLADGLGVLDDLRRFCSDRGVRGAVSFSGGNPLLHPHFIELWRAAAGHGFTLQILGNPAPRARIEEIVAVRRPWFYQVSLEGLPAQNDRVRGAGHFERTVAFLRVLRDLEISTMVMLTLTADNVDEVLPLAARLRGLVDDFHWNRLAMTGEGASLRPPSRERYARFLDEYLDAAAGDPALGIKDNLLNIALRERGLPPFGGCTGFGCGAAFNFLALLPDGEAHACRKLPSPVGNLLREGIAAVYDAPAARRYRAGCAACAGCELRPVCGGCLAVAHGHGLDVFRERDPTCFLGQRRPAAP